MAEVPVIFHCMVYPRDKSSAPYPATLAGFASIAGLEVGGGPIIPPEEKPPVQPPLEIWPPKIWGGSGSLPGGGNYPDNSLPEVPPVDPPDPPVSTQPVKPNAWNWNDGSNPQYPNVGWYYVYVPDPNAAQPGPKRR